MYHISFCECALGTRNVQLMHTHCVFAFSAEKNYFALVWLWAKNIYNNIYYGNIYYLSMGAWTPVPWAQWPVQARYCVTTENQPQINQLIFQQNTISSEHATTEATRFTVQHRTSYSKYLHDFIHCHYTTPHQLTQQGKNVCTMHSKTWTPKFHYVDKPGSCAGASTTKGPPQKI